MFDFGPTTVAAGQELNSPYHTASPSFTGTSWNKVVAADISGGSVTEAAGGVASGVSLKVGEMITSGTTTIDLTAKTYTSNSALGASLMNGPYATGSVGRDGIFASGGGAANRGVGAQISGLAAGIYEIYVSGRNTSTATGTYAQNFFAGTALAGGTTFDFAGYTGSSVSYTTTGASTAWGQGTNYVKFTLTVATGEVVNIASIGDAVGPAEKRGFLNSIQIVSIPEPSSLALFGAGIGFFFLRRRRA